MSRIQKPLSKTVKDTVDVVFELLTSNPGGYEMRAKDLGSVGRNVVRILVQRGIISRERMMGKTHSFKYAWVASSAPTKVLYGSIAQELSDFFKSYNARYNAKKSPAVKETTEPVQEEVQEVVQDEVAVPVQEVTNVNVKVLSDQEIWDVLKSRGYSVDEKGLYIVKKTYLN